VLIFLASFMLCPLKSYAAKEDASLDARLKLAKNVNAIEDIKEEFGKVLPSYIYYSPEDNQYVYKIPEVEYFAAMHALGIIETAGEAIFGALHMYALQTTQTSTSPEARGIIVYFYDHAISVVGNSQDRLTVYLGNKGIEDPQLKSLVTKATDALLQSKYALQEIQNDIKRQPYIYPKD